MSISEKVSYLKGLAEGMKISQDSNEGKLIYEIIKTLELINEEVTDQGNALEELEEYVSELDEDLMALEESFDDEFDDEDDDECECDCDDDCDCEECDCCDDEFEEIECPNCHEIIRYEGNIEEDDQMRCPVCNQLLIGEEDQ